MASQCAKITIPARPSSQNATQEKSSHQGQRRSLLVCRQPPD